MRTSPREDRTGRQTKSGGGTRDMGRCQALKRKGIGRLRVQKQKRIEKGYRGVQGSDIVGVGRPGPKK
jgi:hypothetical protein